MKPKTLARVLLFTALAVVGFALATHGANIPAVLIEVLAFMVVVA